MDSNFKMEEAAKSIGGAITRANHLVAGRTNRVCVETKAFEDTAIAAANDFDKKYSDLLDLAQKFTYTMEILNENNYPSALNGLENGIQWLSEHSKENVDKRFLEFYLYGYICDIYKSEIRIARENAGLTQNQFAKLFDISLSTIKSWDCGRRRPERLKEALIIEKLKAMKKTSQ